MTEHRKGQVLVITAAVIWSIGGALAKLLNLPGPTMAGYRALFAAAAMLPFLRRDRVTFSPLMLFMAACFTAMNLAYVTAITLTTAANAILLQYTAPVWMFFGSVFWLREPVERTSLAGLILGLLGVGIILFGRSPSDTPGVLLALLAGVCYAIVVLCLRRLREHDEFWLTFLNHMAAGVVTLSMISVLPHMGPLVVSPGQFAGLVVFGAVQMALPYAIFTKGVKYITPQEAGVLSLIEPVLNPVFAYVAVGEVPSRATIAGGIVILIGVLLRCLSGDEPRHTDLSGTKGPTAHRGQATLPEADSNTACGIDSPRSHGLQRRGP